MADNKNDQFVTNFYYVVYILITIAFAFIIVVVLLAFLFWPSTAVVNVAASPPPGVMGASMYAASPVIPITCPTFSGQTLLSTSDNQCVYSVPNNDNVVVIHWIN